MNYTFVASEPEDTEAIELLEFFNANGIAFDEGSSTLLEASIGERTGSPNFDGRVTRLPLDNSIVPSKTRISLSNLGKPTETDTVLLWPGSRER